MWATLKSNLGVAVHFTAPEIQSEKKDILYKHILFCYEMLLSLINMLGRKDSLATNWFSISLYCINCKLFIYSFNSWFISMSGHFVPSAYLIRAETHHILAINIHSMRVCIIFCLFMQRKNAEVVWGFGIRCGHRFWDICVLKVFDLCSLSFITAHYLCCF